MKIKVKFFLAWFDFWVGAYWDSNTRALYICLLPTFVFKISFPEDVNNPLRHGAAYWHHLYNQVLDIHIEEAKRASEALAGTKEGE